MASPTMLQLNQQKNQQSIQRLVLPNPRQKSRALLHRRIQHLVHPRPRLRLQRSRQHVNRPSAQQSVQLSFLPRPQLRCLHANQPRTQQCVSKGFNALLICTDESWRCPPCLYVDDYNL
jgi:hypothetical protein